MEADGHRFPREVSSGAFTGQNVMTISIPPRTARQKAAIFRECFTGLVEVYGTYDPQTGSVRQVKQPVTDKVIIRHIEGKQPYGVYLLVQDRTRALAVDFDEGDLTPPMEFLATAKNYGIATYIESSKSKGFHVWMFFEGDGVLAEKARLVTQCILEEIGKPDTEIFPKQNRLEADTQYGNFINAPLFGALVPKGRTVFLDETNPLRAYSDQWELLENVERIPESYLDEIIDINDLAQLAHGHSDRRLSSAPFHGRSSFALPPCARRMLAEGVREFQRLACFRLAVQLRKAGLPKDIAIASLSSWAAKNRPTNNKRIITEAEIIEQTSWAYTKDYRGCGCEDPAVKPFCHPDCPLKRRALPERLPRSRYHHSLPRPVRPGSD
jgi:hypothetical protein